MQRTAFDKWWEITREERFFTSVLFHDLVTDPAPFWRLVSPHLRNARPKDKAAKVDEVGYEVCFFRDAAFRGLIERREQLEKQTFDLVLFLSTDAMVIIEAKAQQCFANRQLQRLQEARRLIGRSTKWPRTHTYLIGLCSSRYSPESATTDQFDGLVRWEEIGENVYCKQAAVYSRADEIYGDRR